MIFNDFFVVFILKKVVFFYFFKNFFSKKSKKYCFKELEKFLVAVPSCLRVAETKTCPYLINLRHLRAIKS